MLAAVCGVLVAGNDDRDSDYNEDENPSSGVHFAGFDCFEGTGVGSFFGGEFGDFILIECLFFNFGGDDGAVEAKSE